MKRSQIKRRPLADTVLASLEPEDKEYRENYGIDGIYFAVKPNGNKRWNLRYKDSDGVWRWAGLGSYPLTTAKMAREKAQQFIKELQQEGFSPVDKKKKEIPTLKTIFLLFYDKQEKNEISEKKLKNMISSFENHVFPVIGQDKPINKITIQDCTAVQKKLQDKGVFSTADRIRSWLNRMFRHAIACGLAEQNPASYMIDAAIKSPKSKNFPHLLESDLPNFLKALKNSHSTLPVKTAAWLSVYTATRPGMVRWAEWSEIDFKNRAWSIPAEKMKMEHGQIIYLTDQVLELLENLQIHTGYSKYLFPSDRSETTPVISDATINKAFSIIGYKYRMTGHGSRHTFKTLISEHGWNKDWSEAQLAHAKTGMEEIYNKAQYLKPRAIMMQWYNDYLDALEKGITEDQKKTFSNKVNKID